MKGDGVVAGGPDRKISRRCGRQPRKAGPMRGAYAHTSQENHLHRLSVQQLPNLPLAANQCWKLN